MFLDGNRIAEAKDVVLADTVNDFRRCQSVDLLSKEGVQPVCCVRIERCHARSGVEPVDGLGD